MTSRKFILDEWIFHDLNGENGAEHQRESFEFLEKMVRECDHIARIQHGPWSAKAYSLMSHTDALRRELSKFFHTAVILDPNKCQTIYAKDLVALPDELRALFPDDDKYLGDLFQTVNAEVIITTDEEVYRAGEQSGGKVRVRLRDEFLKSYLE